MKIIGEINPVVGVTEMYSVVDSNGVLFTSHLNNATYTWYIFKQNKNGAFVNVTKNNVPKIGQTVPYSFGYNVAYRLDVYKLEKDIFLKKEKASFVGSLSLKPTKKGSKAEIKKVVLYNKGAQNVDLAGIGNTLTVKVDCIDMVGEKVDILVWNAENKSNKSNKSITNSKTIEVNNKGIATTQFNVMQLLSMTDNMDLMTGRKKAIGFFGTATYQEQEITNKTPVVVVSQFQSITDIFDKARSTSVYKDTPTPEKPQEGECPNCKKDITVAELQQVYTKATSERLKELALHLNKYKKQYKLDTCARKAHFFAQSIQETGLDLVPGLEGEGFNYYWESLISTFGAFQTKDGKAKAKLWGRAVKDRKTVGAIDVSTQEQILIANYAYSPPADKAKELSNTGANDGWNFRGRGLLQITGRGNYKKIQEIIDKVSPEAKVNIYQKYDKKTVLGINEGAMSAQESVLTGLADWYKDKMYLQADKTGTIPDDKVVNLIVDIINKYTTSRPSRQAHYQKTKVTFVVDNCINIKKEETNKVSEGKWHDPVDNPQLCLYSQGGEVKKPWHGSFGPTIRDGVNKHTGMDLFAKPATNVYACVKSKVVRSEINSSMFGEMIVLQVIDEGIEVIKSRRKNPFKLKYANKSEIESQGFNHNGEFYLVYAHLKGRKVSIGDIVDAGNIIGLTGTSGEYGVPFSTKNPHLHFEIMNVKKQSGLDKKCNPGVYLTYKDEDSLTQSDIAEQEEARKNSKFWRQ